MARKPIKYEMQGDATDLQRSAKDAQRSLKDMEQQAERTDRALDMEANVRVDDSALDRLRRNLMAVRAQVENDISADVDIDAAAALATLRKVERDIRAIDRMEANAKVEVEVETDGDLSTQIKNALFGKGNQPGGMFFGAIPFGMPAKLPFGMTSPQLAAAVTAVAALTAGLAMPVIAGTVGGVIAGVGIKGGLGLLEEFDTLEKLDRKVRIVFGDSENVVRDWAEAISGNVGLGVQDILVASAAIQDLLVPKGFDRGVAADITTMVYERGAALAEFSGVEAVEGIDAVTAALLGQRKQLKGLGVDITAKEVKDRAAFIKQQGYFDIIDKNGQQQIISAQGYNEKMLETAATLDLVGDKSTDAWTAFNEGGTTADDVLDTLNSTFANVKTELTRGLGGIFVGLVEDVLRVNDSFGSMGDAAGGVAEYIERNADQIRAFMLKVAELVLQGAKAFVDMGAYIIKVIIDTAPFMSASTRAVGALAAALQAAAGAALILTGNLSSGMHLITTADDTYKLAEAAAEAGESFAKNMGPDILSGLEGASGVIDGVLTDVKRIQDLDAADIAIRAHIDAADISAAKATIDYLSEDEIAVIKAKIDPDSTDATDRALNDLLDARLVVIEAEAVTAEATKDLNAVVDKKWGVMIPAAVPNITSAERDLAYLSRDRTANIRVKATNVTGGYAMGTGRALERSAAIRNVRVPSNRAGEGPSISLADAWTGPPQVIIQGTILDPDGTARALEEVMGSYYGRTGRR
jgi:hypothetical protein